MKRSRHKPRPKFTQSPDPAGFAELYPNLLCDLTPELREQLPTELFRAERERAHTLQQSLNEGG
jgi:hypothetical protein